MRGGGGGDFLRVYPFVSRFKIGIAPHEFGNDLRLERARRQNSLFPRFVLVVVGLFIYVLERINSIISSTHCSRESISQTHWRCFLCAVHALMGVGLGAGQPQVICGSPQLANSYWSPNNFNVSLSCQSVIITIKVTRQSPIRQTQNEKKTNSVKNVNCTAQ